MPDKGWTQGDNTFSVSGDTPCVVAVSYDGGVTYIRAEAILNSNNDYSFTVEDMTSDTILTILMLGDINGDGIISNLDVTKGNAANLGKTELSNLQVLVADVNGDGQLSNLDITKLRAVVCGQSELSW